MKKHYLITLILMALAFAAGYFWQHKTVSRHPEQEGTSIEHKKPAIEPETTKTKPITIEQLPLQQEAPESVLQELLISHQYQRAIDFYRDAFSDVDTVTSPRLYQQIVAHLQEQLKAENFNNVFMLSNLYLLRFPHDYPIALLAAHSHLAIGERRQAIELFYSIVQYVSDQKEQSSILETIHQLCAEEYASASSRQQWKELESFYQYLLIQENNYWPYYLNYAVVLIHLQEYTQAENQLLLLLSHDELKEQANTLLARIKLLRAGGSVLALQEYGNNYIRTVTLNGETDVNLVLDTGASISVIDTRIFQKLSENDYEKIRNAVTMQTANGPVQASTYRIRELQLGNYHLENIEFAVLPMDNKITAYNGLLGMNILNRFHFELDQKNKELVLQPRM